MPRPTLKTPGPLPLGAKSQAHLEELGREAGRILAMPDFYDRQQAVRGRPHDEAALLRALVARKQKEGH